MRVDRADLTVKCSCPSHKFPCKHGLGLLLLAAADPAALPSSEPPEWVTDWLARRATTAAKRAAAPKRATATKSADRRLARVTAGVAALDLWLADLVRAGLASVEARPMAFWEAQAARLVDAQAPGLAGGVRRLGAIPNASRDWPARLLDGLGRLALLTDAFRRLDALPADLREDVRGAIGWTLGQEEVVARGETVADEWLVLGQRVGEEEKVRAQRTWLAGARSGRYALVLQFAAGGQPFGDPLAPGTRFAADLAFYPSAWPQRAVIVERRGAPTPIGGPLPGLPSCAALLDEVAASLARQPWLERWPVVLAGVVPARDGAGWWARDGDGAALPLAPGDHWRLLALAGGRPAALAAEWDGAALTPLGVLADDAYHPLGEDA